MKKITITAGVTTILSNATADAYIAECEAIENERKIIMRERERAHKNWLFLQSMEPTDPLYSDIYKDVYGFHPR